MENHVRIVGVETRPFCVFRRFRHLLRFLFPENSFYLGKVSLFVLLPFYVFSFLFNICLLYTKFIRMSMTNIES
ncbi:unnamed protein product [Arabidopsis halleri]